MTEGFFVGNKLFGSYNFPSSCILSWSFNARLSARTHCCFGEGLMYIGNVEPLVNFLPNDVFKLLYSATLISVMSLRSKKNPIPSE